MFLAYWRAAAGNDQAASGVVFGSAEGAVPKQEVPSRKYAEPMQTFVLAGGCFWCLDAVYRTLRGVSDVVSGYTGGTGANPSYEAVCTGATGHAEAVAVTFDPEVIPAEVILDVFFSLHDPRQLNRQGNDIGTQYRSAMFYKDAEQKALFETARDRASEYWDGGIVTEITELAEWYDAESYHQDFFAKNPGQGYCMAVAVPKVIKIRKSFAEYVLAS
jgi:peptide-methionine (S)-S-oxide reductase